MENCGGRGGSVNIIDRIEEQDVIVKIQTHLREKELHTPPLPFSAGSKHQTDLSWKC